jgi:hypothetical protein
VVILSLIGGGDRDLLGFALSFLYRLTGDSNLPFLMKLIFFFGLFFLGGIMSAISEFISWIRVLKLGLLDFCCLNEFVGV